MITGIFSEVLKTLLADADKAFSSGVLGKAIQTVAKGPQAPSGVLGNAIQTVAKGPQAPSGATGAVTGALPGPPARAGANVFRPAAESGESVPILKRILDVLESLARKAGILPRVAGGPSVSQSLQNLAGGGGTPAAQHQVTQNTGGSAGYRFSQIANQLAGKPFFKAHVPAPAVPAGAGLAKTLLSLGRMAGVVGLVTGVISTAAYVVKSFVTGMAAANNDLAKWNAGIATSVANLQLTQFRAEAQTASDVSPSAQMLNSEIGRLIEETQPLMAGIQTIGNYAATLVVLVTRIVTFIPNVLSGIASLPDSFGDEMDGAIRKNKKAVDGPLDADWRALGVNPPGIANPPRPKVIAPKAPAFIPPMDKPDRNRGAAGR